MENKEVLNDKVKPYNQNESKTRQLKAMFNTISKDYDFFNNLMSWGLAHIWRRKGMLWLKIYKPDSLLDIATGTADMIVLADKILHPSLMRGIDISDQMISVGDVKLKAHDLDQKAKLEVQDCASLQFPENSFDAVSISFGIRNLEKLSQSISEINRVLKTGGHFLIIEMNEPQKGLVAFLYKVYVKIYIMMAARLLSNDKSAYQYLTKSMHYFPQGKDLVNIITALNFKMLKYKSFTMGVCSAYLFEKTN